MELDPKIDEDFLNGEQKAYHCIKMLEDMQATSKTDADQPGFKLVASTSQIADFYVKHDATAKKTGTTNKRAFLNGIRCKEQEPLRTKSISNAQSRYEDTAWQRIKEARPSVITMDKHTFVRLLGEDPKEYAKVLKERQDIAQKFRINGNNAFQQAEFVLAIRHYTQAIEYVPDSPVLYNNRAISYINVKNYRRALLDCEKVLTQIDEKNMRAWLYRCWAYKRLGDEKGFEDSVEMARKNNTKEIEYIDAFLEKLNFT